MSTQGVNKDFVQLIAAEMSTCVDRAVALWMAEFDSVLNDPRLTTLGRLQGVRNVIERYKDVTGKNSPRIAPVGHAAPIHW
jgi:hypothetical protein